MNCMQETRITLNIYKSRVNILLRLFFMFLIAVSSMFGIAGCANTQDPAETFDGNLDGAYFITDDSYEKINASRPENMFRCVIANDKMMLSGRENNVCYIYDIAPESDGYFKGASITGTISFWFEGNKLCIDYDGQTIEFKKDKAYMLIEGEAVTLNSPKNIEVSIGIEGLGYVQFQWNYQSDFGNFGAAIEIKTASSQEFEAVKKVERVYMNMFTVQIDCSNFETGENYVRLYHIGGPDITNNKSIKLYENSDYAVYCVIVDDSGRITVRQ